MSHLAVVAEYTDVCSGYNTKQSDGKAPEMLEL